MATNRLRPATVPRVGSLFERLIPVLPVASVETEVAFYAALGFEAQPTYTGFTALRNRSVLFGIQDSGGRVPPEDLEWQIEVTDVHAAHELALARGLEIVSAPASHPAGFWLVKLRTPNGYVLTLEGPAPTSIQA
jgi:predicted enzyme related to lactoylglutathione lyase